MNRENHGNCFLGFAVGNGMVSYTTNIDTLPMYAYNHGIISLQNYSQLRSTCDCKGKNEQNFQITVVKLDDLFCVSMKKRRPTVNILFLRLKSVRLFSRTLTNTYMEFRCSTLTT